AVLPHHRRNPRHRDALLPRGALGPVGAALRVRVRHPHRERGRPAGAPAVAALVHPRPRRGRQRGAGRGRGGAGAADRAGRRARVPELLRAARARGPHGGLLRDGAPRRRHLPGRHPPLSAQEKPGM
ncbi:MAG: hypothetical protein AVDCRST_MAG89-5020, partial [uncultured Gemmatimonadetes bacterium]